MPAGCNISNNAVGLSNYLINNDDLFELENYEFV
jgi:hypothetical protein